MTPEQYRGLMEALNMKGSVKENDKKYKEVARRLGNMKFSLASLNDSEQLSQLMSLVDDGTMDLDDLLVLAQFDKAITKQDTRAAEFIRDTRGEKPSTQLEVTDVKSPLSTLTEEQLHALMAIMLPQEGEEEIESI